MEITSNLSRREFLEKMAPAALGITLAPGIIQALQAQGTPFFLQKPTESTVKDIRKFVPVMITPYDDYSKIDFNKVSRLIDFYLAAGAKGFFANCLSSEMFYMTDEERIALTKHVVKYVNGKVPVVSTGSFGETVKKKAAFAAKIHDTGVDAVILISGHLARKDQSDDVLIENFEKMFERTGSMRLGTYECPLPYKRIISPKVFSFLVSNKRMIYHKDTSEDITQIKAKLEICRGTQMEFYDAHSATALEALQNGAKGLSPISGNFYPEIHSWLCENANNLSRSAEASWIQDEIAKMEPVISKFYPIGSKYFLQKRGLPIPLTCRSNSAQLPAEQRKILDGAYTIFLGWCERLEIRAVSV
ncbi:dihydrodipicolinate synthase family protein [Dyadobacter frigoris]|uniref:Dihydrodipicolinate synthase family protein n=1 Tax=Dyadobacter frigoris TaxID=2576211 RepID=A0A4V6BJF8_9BACT|nr:dihydrodipicolinate synthase family protein [Dyadobacter frigoris]TKT88763.1 dihydrodipicolinate synthase family protein [Dyadobacter frigoris]GLU53955.1 dihydrodipicolinate synthase family protein [Dyadobacter frigoris]